MHPSTLLLAIAPFFAATALATAAPDQGAVKAESRSAPVSPEVAPLAKRDCKSNGCKCRKERWVTQGQYCGRCSALESHGRGGSKYHIYECSDKGKNCCNYEDSVKCSGDNWWRWCPK